MLRIKNEGSLEDGEKIIHGHIEMRIRTKGQESELKSKCLIKYPVFK